MHGKNVHVFGRKVTGGWKIMNVTVILQEIDFQEKSQELRDWECVRKVTEDWFLEDFNTNVPGVRFHHDFKRILTGTRFHQSIHRWTWSGVLTNQKPCNQLRLGKFWFGSFAFFYDLANCVVVVKCWIVMPKTSLLYCLLLIFIVYGFILFSITLEKILAIVALKLMGW